ncbi:MAG: proline racemase family protein [Acidimicrobiales bacterium]|nr:proline racemase family protein [Acidimicrobiales bacterium]
MPPDPPSPDRSPMHAERRRTIWVTDAHYGGDVSRVVLRGIPRVPGNSVLEKRHWLEDEGDSLRRMLLGPPYGDPSMCANVIVDPTIPEAQAGYVIMEAMGYPHFSGSNSICVVAALLEAGEIPLGPAGDQTVLLEAPAGLITAVAHHDGTHVHAVALDCDAAWVAARNVVVELPDFGPVTFDLVWSGCFYAMVDAEANGFALTAAERPTLAEFAHELCLVATGEVDLTHPSFGDTGHLSFVGISGPVPDGPVPDGTVIRSATYVHPGVVCRCPTGTGTAARMALLADDGRLAPGSRVVTESPTGSRMTGEIVEHPELHGRRATRARITGRPFTLGVTELVVNFDDDLTECDGIWELLDLPDFEWPPTDRRAAS